MRPSPCLLREESFLAGVDASFQLGHKIWSGMGSTNVLTKRQLLLSVIALCLASPFSLQSQIGPGNVGNTAVYQSSGHVVGSSAVIDATVFPGNDVCAKIHAILTSPDYPPNGAVIDARGTIVPLNRLNCMSGSPWGGTPPANGWPPATILLPPGGVTIHTPWVLPNGTRLLGERRNTTEILPASDFPDGATMIQMGSSDPAFCPSENGTPVCRDIAIQFVSLDGESRNPPNGAPVNGIDNEYARDLSYVDHVDFRLIEGVGITIGPGAVDSGPYSNLIYAAGGPQSKGETTQTSCIEINAPTRGIHGMTCTANGVPYAGVHLNAGNNTIEDVHFEGVVDGIVVGDNVSAGTSMAGNVLISIDAGHGGNTGAVINAIHICNPNSPTPGTACSAGNWLITDFTVLGATAEHAARYTSPIALQDDLTETTLHTSQSAATGVSLYALGEPVTIGGKQTYTRFSSTASTPNSQQVPIWGAGALGTTGLPTPCPTGAIFSNTSNTLGSNHTLYVCVGSAWSPVPGT